MRIGHTKGGLSSKLHAVSDGKGRPPILPLSEGQMSHYKGSADDRCLAQRQSLLGDRGYDTDWFRDALARRGLAASIPPKANRQEIGRAACRERGCQYGEISVVAGPFKKKKLKKSQ